jgi:predicted nucleotidyltransferase
MRRDEVLSFLSFHRQELMERFGVCSLALFGSVARDEAGPESDVDILVEFRETPELSEYMSLKFWIEDRLGRRVDLVMEKALTRHLPHSTKRLLLIQAVEESETRLRRSKCCAGAKTSLGIEVSQSDRREFFDQLIDTDLTPSRELAQLLVLLIWQANRQGAHDSISFCNSSGRNMRRPGK